MNNRYVDAYYAQQGACNPLGLAQSLMSHIHTVIEEGGSPSTDVAISMIIHQLTSLHAMQACSSNDELTKIRPSEIGFYIIAAAYTDVIRMCADDDQYTGTADLYKEQAARGLIHLLYMMSRAYLYDHEDYYTDDYAIIEAAYKEGDIR
jgi:hypothetical protein